MVSSSICETTGLKFRLGTYVPPPPCTPTPTPSQYIGPPFWAVFQSVSMKACFPGQSTLKENSTIKTVWPDHYIPRVCKFYWWVDSVWLLLHRNSGVILEYLDSSITTKKAIFSFPVRGPGMHTLLWGIHEVALASADLENSNPWWRSSSKLRS